jgi:hypothetical protein
MIGEVPLWAKLIWLLGGQREVGVDWEGGERQKGHYTVDNW